MKTTSRAIIFVFAFGVVLPAAVLLRRAHAAPTCPYASATTLEHGYDGPQTTDLCLVTLRYTGGLLDVTDGAKALHLRLSALQYTRGHLTATGYNPTAPGVYRSGFEVSLTRTAAASTDTTPRRVTSAYLSSSPLPGVGSAT